VVFCSATFGAGVVAAQRPITCPKCQLQPKRYSVYKEPKKGVFMSNFSKLIGIIALAAAIGFSMTACPTDNDGDGGGSIGEKLELSGQVYTGTLNGVTETENGFSWTSITYSEYKGNLTIKDNNGGSAKITGGKLSYTIETPNSLDTCNDFLNNLFLTGYDDNNDEIVIYDDITASDTSANFFTLRFLDNNTSTLHALSKGNTVMNFGNITSESVKYVYVDRDVTISGKGKTRTETETEDGTTYTYTTTYKDFNLALKAGWNAIHSKGVALATITGTSYTSSISLNNPSLKWVLTIIEWEGEDD
jgi:hypothetical protein